MHPAPASRHARAAFTLIELLTVIAILGVLGAILVAVVGRVSTKAKEATTASRLRQVYTAQMLYAQENRMRVTPFYRNDDARTNETTWQQLLLPYINRRNVPGATEDPALVFNSPYQVREEGVPYWSQGRSFGLNNFMAHANWRYYVGRVPNPSQTVLAGDMVQGNVDFVNTSDGVSWSASGLSWGLPAYRHAGGTKAMFVFFDGHVESLTAEELLLQPQSRPSVWRWW